MVDGEARPPVFGQRDVAGGRQPAELDREQEDQHDPEPEIRCRDAPQREQVGAIVPGRPLLHRGNDARGDADHKGNDGRHQSELQRHRQLLRDQAQHRHPVAQRLAEVTGENALDPVDILHRDRLIEMVLLADLLDHGRIALFAGHHQRRVARQQMLQREDQHRHEEQCRDDLQDPLAEKIQHEVIRVPGAAQRERCAAEPGPSVSEWSRLCGAALRRCTASGTRVWYPPLTSASARPRAPDRPASGRSLRVSSVWAIRICGGRGRSTTRPWARSW